MTCFFFSKATIFDGGRLQTKKIELLKQKSDLMHL